MGGADAGMYGGIHAQNTKRRDAAAGVQGTQNGQDAGGMRGEINKQAIWPACFLTHPSIHFSVFVVPSHIFLLSVQAGLLINLGALTDG